jgi:hypothetical protein
MTKMYEGSKGWKHTIKGHFGHFHNMYAMYIFTKYVAINFGFHF